MRNYRKFIFTVSLMVVVSLLYPNVGLPLAPQSELIDLVASLDLNASLLLRDVFSKIPTYGGVVELDVLWQWIQDSSSLHTCLPVRRKDQRVIILAKGFNIEFSLQPSEDGHRINNSNVWVRINHYLSSSISFLSEEQREYISRNQGRLDRMLHSFVNRYRHEPVFSVKYFDLDRIIELSDEDKDRVIEELAGYINLGVGKALILLGNYFDMKGVYNALARKVRDEIRLRNIYALYEYTIAGDSKKPRRYIPPRNFLCYEPIGEDVMLMPLYQFVYRRVLEHRYRDARGIRHVPIIIEEFSPFFERDARRLEDLEIRSWRDVDVVVRREKIRERHYRNPVYIIREGGEVVGGIATSCMQIDGEYEKNIPPKYKVLIASHNPGGDTIFDFSVFTDVDPEVKKKRYRDILALATLEVAKLQGKRDVLVIPDSRRADIRGFGPQLFTSYYDKLQTITADPRDRGELARQIFGRYYGTRPSAEGVGVKTRSRYPYDFSIFKRERNLRALSQQGEPLDILIIGGGIAGAGIARDAALRGLRVGLVEKGDFGSGTSSKSSRLIHAGLRYLEYIPDYLKLAFRRLVSFDFDGFLRYIRLIWRDSLKLVFEASIEKRILLRIAPHLVRPLGFLIPVYESSSRGLLKVIFGTWLYDILSLFRNTRMHKTLFSRRAVTNLEKGVGHEGLRGGVLYYDAKTLDSRLVLENILSADAKGALITNYTEVVAITYDYSDRISGVIIEDKLTGKKRFIRARKVVNAGGPWMDKIRRLDNLAGGHDDRLLRLTRGSHIIVPKIADNAVLISASDKRVIFVIPMEENRSLIGTTDVEHEEDDLDNLQPLEEEVDYLIRETNRIFPEAKLTRDMVISAYTGVRPLVESVEGVTQTSRISRAYEIFESSTGLISIGGVKLTAYRKVAQEVVDRLMKGLILTNRPESVTSTTPLYGADMKDIDEYAGKEVPKAIVRYGIDIATAEYLINKYGSKYAKVLMLTNNNPSLKERIIPHLPYIKAEIVYSAHFEMVVHLWDFVMRRTDIDLQDDVGIDDIWTIARLLAGELGWSAEKIDEEIEDYVEHSWRIGKLAISSIVNKILEKDRDMVILNNLGILSVLVNGSAHFRLSTRFNSREEVRLFIKSGRAEGFLSLIIGYYVLFGDSLWDGMTSEEDLIRALADKFKKILGIRLSQYEDRFLVDYMERFWRDRDKAGMRETESLDTSVPERPITELKKEVEAKTIKKIENNSGRKPGLLYFDLDKIIEETQETASQYLDKLEGLADLENYAVVVVNSCPDRTMNQILGRFPGLAPRLRRIIARAVPLDAGTYKLRNGRELIERAIELAREKLNIDTIPPENITVAIYSPNSWLYQLDLLKDFSIIIMTARAIELDEEMLNELEKFLPGIRNLITEKRLLLLKEEMYNMRSIMDDLEETEREIGSQA